LTQYIIVGRTKYLACALLTACSGSHSPTPEVQNANPVTTTYTVSANISGLSGTLVLQNNGADNLSIASSGVATFKTAVSDGGSYSVTVEMQPSGQNCIVVNGSGTVNSSNVSNVMVACNTSVSASIPPMSGRVTHLGVPGHKTALAGTSRRRPTARVRAHEFPRSMGCAGILGTIL
jgi:hypothetical protein